MANRILGVPLFCPPSGGPLSAKRDLDIRPTPLDWAAEWLRHHLSILSEEQRKRIVLAVIGKRDIGRTLIGWEVEIARAWDDAVAQWRAHSSAEGGK